MNIEELIKKINYNLLPLAITKKDRENLNTIINAIKIVDRIFFVKDKDDAYLDSALPIGYNQTISQPSTVARMLMLAELEPGQNLLELGSGSGWNAVLAGFILYPGKVLSLDIVSQLVEQAHKNLGELIKNLGASQQEKLSHIEFRNQNIFKNLNSWEERYDRIIITAGIRLSQEEIINELAQKTLKNEGILVCPHTHGPLIILRKKDGEITKETTFEQYVFVPLLN